jgi:hypothetical protein
MIRISAVLLPIALLMSVFPSLPAAQEVPPTLTVSSIYWDPMLKTWGTQTEWVFSPPDSPARANGYELQVTRKGEEAPTVVLSYGSKHGGNVREQGDPLGGIPCAL